MFDSTNPLLHPVEELVTHLDEVGSPLLGEADEIRHAAFQVSQAQAHLERCEADLRQRREALLRRIHQLWDGAEISFSASVSTATNAANGISPGLAQVSMSISHALGERGHGNADLWRMSGREMFAEYCDWHGLINWSDTLWVVVQVLMARNAQMPVVKLGE